MDRIKLMIDSGSDIPREVAEALNAEVVPHLSHHRWCAGSGLP